MRLPGRGRLRYGRGGPRSRCMRCLLLLLLRDCCRLVEFRGIVTENLQISSGLRRSLLQWVSCLLNCPRARPRARRCSALASRVPDCCPCVVFSGMTATADLSGRHKEVALVGSAWASSYRVPAIVLHVKLGAEPFSVLALSAFDTLAAVRAHTYFQGHAASATSFSAFASALSFPLPCLPLPFLAPVGERGSHRGFGSQVCLPW